MIEQIAMWGGFAGIIVAVFAIVILFLTRKNILDILEKDVILFDKNFELKKHAIDNALNIVDELDSVGASIKSRPDFVDRSKKCYNDLLCVVTNVKLAEEFHSLTLNHNDDASSARLAQFKVNCRKDIGLSTKGVKSIKALKKDDHQIPPTPNPMSGYSGFDGGASFQAPPAPKKPDEVSSEFKPTPRPMPQTTPRPMPRPMSQPTPRPMPQRPTDKN